MYTIETFCLKIVSNMPNVSIFAPWILKKKI